jgi:hypothetical protein
MSIVFVRALRPPATFGAYGARLAAVRCDAVAARYNSTRSGVTRDAGELAAFPDIEVLSIIITGFGEV